MHDGRPSPDIWGNIITCVEIADGIHCIVGSKKKGLEMPKEVAEEILPESVTSQATVDGDSLCITDPVSNAIAADALVAEELVTDPKKLSVLDSLRQLDEPEAFTGFESPITDIELDGLELE